MRPARSTRIRRLSPPRPIHPRRTPQPAQTRAVQTLHIALPRPIGNLYPLKSSGMQQIFGPTRAVFIKQLRKTPAQRFQSPSGRAFKQVMGGAKLLPVCSRKVRNRMVADLLQQRRLAVAPCLFQLMVAGCQRCHKQLRIQMNRMIRLPPLHRRAKCLFMSRVSSLFNAWLQASKRRACCSTS